MNFLDYRQEPRYATHFPSWVTTSESVRIAAITTNLSLSGLEISGDHTLMTTLYPNFKRPNFHDPVEICVEFEVPTGTENHAPVWIYCHLVYCRRKRVDYYSIGCTFSKIDSITEKNLTNYLQNLTQKPVCHVD